MQRRSRGIAPISVSALDLFAMAVGSFVLITVVLLPFYQKRATLPTPVTATSEQGAATETAPVPGENGIERMKALRAAAAEARGRAAAAEAEAQSAETAAAAARKAAAEGEAQARRLRGEAAAIGDAPVPVRDPSPVPAPPRASGPPIPEVLDLVFVVDATSSMDEAIGTLADSMAGLARVLQRMVPSLRVGIVAYRDYDVPGPVAEILPLTDARGDGLDRIVGFLDRLRVIGGRTSDEAVVEGLRRAAGMDFRPGARRLMLVLGDAKAHPEQQLESFAIVRGFTRSAAKASVATLWVPTQNALRYGRGDRAYFQALAEAGSGPFSERVNALTEAVIIGLLEQ